MGRSILCQVMSKKDSSDNLGLIRIDSHEEVSRFSQYGFPALEFLPVDLCCIFEGWAYFNVKHPTKLRFPYKSIVK